MEESNKRIFKNTVYLYFRQLIIIALSFISTRIVLDKLGVDDYGIYNVVGGFVSLFTILNSVLNSATRRFMAIAIGAGDSSVLKKTFDTSIVLHAMIALAVMILLETLGLWVLNAKLNIVPDRMAAANWVFQFSVLNVIVTITQTPYTAAVTAHEKFNIYAIISIFDIIAKIAVLFLLVVIPLDKLIVYAALTFTVSLISRLIYIGYCSRNFPECKKIRMKADKPLLSDMLRFSGWDSFGNVTSIANTQGITLMLNMFFNTAVNASRGLANSVTATIDQFVSGFIQAAEPQLAKFYAQNDYKRFEKLIFNVSQMTLFMLAIIAVPVWMEMEFVLQLWLGTVPEYTAEFIKITIISCFVSYSNLMLIKGCTAIGRVKENSLYMAPAALIHLPLVYIVLKLGWSPIAVYWVSIIPSVMRMFIALNILKRFKRFPALRYFTTIFLKNMAIVILACVIPYIIRNMMAEGWLRFLVVCGVSVICTVILMWLLALNGETRKMVLKKVVNILSSQKKW